MKKNNHKYTNHLIKETSPYLLQHAHNPVDWHPWNEATLSKAKKENKPLLVSIGYSACHWCHVMEKESFEDEAVAETMNKNFICIKVDREERPDVDHVYMDAVQMLSGRGGWPLNAFAMPDGSPFWGATYFPKEQWLDVLCQINHLFENEKQKLEQQAHEISNGMTENQPFRLVPVGSKLPERTFADEMAQRLLSRADRTLGGFRGAPKFPMPSCFVFLLHYYAHAKNPEALSVVELTVQKMAHGGIYDQIGGGFARYSVDERWHVPHFEKMLYDNAQLVTLYAEAFKLTGNPFYAEVVKETLAFVSREMTSSEGSFYAALDADSEGEEGKFYVWTKEEFDKIVGEHHALVSEYFGIGDAAYWENNNNVPVRSKTIEDLAGKYSLPVNEIKEIIRLAKADLLTEREKRVRPGLDDKVLTSWNALMLKGFVSAYRSLDDDEYLNTAIRAGEFIKKHMVTDTGVLMRNYKNGKATIPGFLDDYSFTIEGFISLYEVTMNEMWLNKAKDLADYCIEHFFDKSTGMFYYVSDMHKDTVTKTTEVYDNVIPSSNSCLAISLHKLGLLFEEKNYKHISERMLMNIADNMVRYPSAFSNWGNLLLKRVYPYHTVVITGPDAPIVINEFHRLFLPGVLIAGSQTASELPVFENRFIEGETLIYVCTGSECQLPAKSVREALKWIEPR